VLQGTRVQTGILSDVSENGFGLNKVTGLVVDAMISVATPRRYGPRGPRRLGEGRGRGSADEEERLVRAKARGAPSHFTADLKYCFIR
jgi:hypothetical protein